MMTHFRLAVKVLFSAIISTTCSAQYEITSESGRVPIGLEMQFMKVDSEIDNPLRLPQGSFESCLHVVPNFNVTKQAIWLKLDLLNTGESGEFLIDVAQPQLEYVELFSPEGAGTYKGHSEGFFKNFSLRQISNQNYIFPIYIKQGEKKTYYLKILSGGQIQVPVYVGPSEVIRDGHHNKDIKFGLYMGVMLAMLLYNLFIYLFSKERSYLLYVIYMAVVFVTQANFQGYTIRWFWPELAWLEYNATTILSCLAGISATFFFIDFVHLREFGPKAIKWLYGFIALYCLSMISAWVGQPQVAYVILQATAFFLALTLMFLSIWLYRSGVREALYFLIAWSVFLTGVCIFILKDFNILPYNNFTYNVMSVGSALEAIFLSIALAQRISALKREKEESQALALNAMMENESIIRRQNEILEVKVSERTRELQRSNKELSQAMSDLKSAQIKIVENEKMASLGQLVAGVAHELNNPINFVSSNVSPLRRDIAEFYSLLEIIKEIEPEGENADSLAKLKELQQKIESERLKEEIEALLRGIEEGASRTAEIVKGLRIFSRLDEQDLKKANINDCVKSTLVVLKTLLRNKVRVETQQGPLEAIDCYPGKINQVLMNLINNAFHAISAAEKGYEDGLIQIVTMQNDEHVILTIKDNGTGMSEDVQKKIFDPFFTTKEVGEGTGLGLSIVHGIINDHQGRIEVDSEPGKGTCITLYLPRHMQP